MAIRSDALRARLRHLYPLSEDEERVLEGAFSGAVSVPRDTDIVRDGDHPTQCSLLMEGFVYRYKLLPDGKRQILAFHVPGEIFDTQSFLLDTMDHSVAALTAAKIGIITHVTMREITEKFPRITRALWKETLVEAAVFRQWLTSAGRRSAYQRLAHLACELYVRERAVNLGEKFAVPWPFTQVELGDALGLTPIHINRTLQQLRRAGLITLRAGSMRILDWDRLVEAGEFDPAYLQLRDIDIP
jgi:CRP-like cAMP-binding protein